MARIEVRLQELPTDPLGLATYDGLVPSRQIEHVRDRSRDLAGVRVLFISTAPPEPSDASGAITSLLLGLGVDAERALLHGDAAFSRAARELADGLAGADCRPADAALQGFREAGETAAIAFDTRNYDVVIAHGAGAVALIEGRRDEHASWVWRSGRDISAPDPEAWAGVGPLLAEHAAISVALAAFAPEGLAPERLRVTPGAFDPLAPAQRDPRPGALSSLLEGVGLDLSRPVTSQIGRLDAAADPLAAIEAWRLAKEEVPGLQLAIAGRVDASDPAAFTVLDEARAFAGPGSGLVLATDRSGASEAQIGAIGRVSRCALPVSLSDAFDPEVSASLWRGTPVVAEGAGAKDQIEDGVDGYAVSGNGERAARLIELASDPRRGAAMGRAGRSRARERSTVVRLLGDELELLGSLIGAGAAPGPAKVHA